MTDRDREPRMLRHARTDRAYIQYRDADGNRRQKALGKWDSPEAQRSYHLELAKWHARQRSGEAAAALLEEPDTELTIAGAAVRWLSHCEGYYRHEDGTPTSELASCRYAVAPLLELFGAEPLDTLSPKRLKVVRDRMIRGDPRLPAEKRRGWCRSVANHCTARIRSFVKWCVSEGLATPSLHAGLCTLAPLKRGRTDAREAPLRHPVADADVEKTLPHLPPVVADMVRVQHLVGMRGAELCAMVTAELDRSESIEPGCWVFRPRRSKLSYRGRGVEYMLGPQAVAIVSRYVKADPLVPLFQPSESELARHVAMRERRCSPVQPSQLDRSKPDPKRTPGDRYDACSYGRAVARACARAGVRWSPHDLRRAVATRIRARFGIEAARCVIGHQTIAMAELYGHRDLKVAAEIAKEVG